MACVRVIQFEGVVHYAAIAPDGQQLVVGSLNSSVQLLDARSGERRATLGEGCSVAFSPAASASQPLLLAVGHSTDTVRVWDCSSSGDCVAQLQGHSLAVFGVAFSPDGRLLASASDDKTVQLWRTDDWCAPPAVLRGHTHYVYGVSFSCDGRMLASCSKDRTVRLWHILDSGADAAATAGPVLDVGLWVNCVAFSPVDSRLLACGGKEGFLALAKVGAGDGGVAMERELQGHTKTVVKLAFSPCGQKLASVSYDQTVRLWSVVSGACLRVLWGHTNIVNAVAFFPNGKQLASGSSDQTVRIWTLCTWSDQTHHLFGAPLKAAVFSLMCVRARLDQDQELEQQRAHQLPRLPMEVWLLVFEQLQQAIAAQA
jgi:WD40 repeat protein